MPVQTTPFYLVPANEPFLREYDTLFTRFAEADLHTLVLDVHSQSVNDGEVAALQQIILALQHHPELIEKMIFALDLKFTEIEGSSMYFPEQVWKTDTEYYRWFHKLADSPFMMFFLNDEDARFYTLAGDLLADNQLEIKPADRYGRNMVGIDGDQLIQVVNRLFNSCWWMLIYCHGSGFNPEPYIQSVLADLDLPVTYEQVYESYQEEIKKSLHFRTIATE